MRNDFDLHLSSDRSPTTLGGSCIDMVFTRQSIAYIAIDTSLSSPITNQ
jgi:hypothetical protein